MILVPSGSEFLFQPLRRRTPGAPPSTIQCSTAPSGFSTSIYSQVCGLDHSIFTTLPSSLSGLLESNSAEKEWWAATGSAAATSGRAVAKIVVSFRFMNRLLVSANRLPYGRGSETSLTVAAQMKRAWAAPGASGRYREVYQQTARTYARAVAHSA